MAKIQSDSRNVRKHDARNKQVIFDSLKELGAGRSILIDAADTAVAGNGVLEQAEKLGIPIRVVESDGSELIAVKRIDLAPDDPKRKALAIVDNRSNDLSFFDNDELLKLAEETENWKDKLGFDEKEFEELFNSNGILNDLIENNFANSVKAMSNVFSITFVFPKTTGGVVTSFIQRHGKQTLTQRLIDMCTEAEA